MTTIKEIALRSNVSPSTVSRILNNDQSLSVALNTRNRVLEIAKDLGYTTIRSRKKVLEKDSIDFKIGIFLSHSVEEELSDPYFLSIRQGVEMQCREMGVQRIDVYRFHEELSQLNEELDGLVVIGVIDKSLMAKIEKKVKHFVYIDYSPLDDLYDCVTIDFEKSTHLVINHFIALGHVQIGYIGGEKNEFSKEKQYLINSDGRYIAYTNIMKKLNKFKEENVYTGDFTMADGYRLMKEAISKGDLPGAFFIASDPMAIGALRALQEENIKVPEDVAIVAFDDLEMAQYASSPLSTIHVPTELMGRTGVKMLIDRLNGRELPLKVIIPTRLVIRESCGRL